MSRGPRQVHEWLSGLLGGAKKRQLTNVQTQPRPACRPLSPGTLPGLFSHCSSRARASKEAGDPGSLWAGDLDLGGDPRGQVGGGLPAVTWRARKSWSVALRGGQNKAPPPQMRPSPEARNP